MAHYHAVVWLDHKRARIHQIIAYDVESETVFANCPNTLAQRQDRDHDPGPRTGKKTAEDRRHYEAVVRALEPAQAWPILGPGLAKKELVRHIEAPASRFRERIAAVDAAEHLSDGEILERARAFFRAYDRMTPQLKTGS